jgi:hypothetical protein
MKNTIISISVGLVLTAGLLLTAQTVNAGDAPAGYEWAFGTDVNPAPAAGAGAGAAILPGEFASGWLADMAALPGGAGGYWDLGKEGKITLTFPQGLAGPITVKVAQWWDGGIYGGLAAVNVPGAAVAAEGANIDRLGSLGGWVVDETTWTPASGTPLVKVVVQAGATGAVIDSIVVEAAAAAVVPPVLTIQTVGNRVVISWPESAQSMALQSNDNLASAQGWQAVEVQAQIANGTCSVELPADAAVKFYRLKQP